MRIFGISSGSMDVIHGVYVTCVTHAAGVGAGAKLLITPATCRGKVAHFCLYSNYNNFDANSDCPIAPTLRAQSLTDYTQ